MFKYNKDTRYTLLNTNGSRGRNILAATLGLGGLCLFGGVMYYQGSPVEGGLEDIEELRSV